MFDVLNLYGELLASVLLISPFLFESLVGLSEQVHYLESRDSNTIPLKCILASALLALKLLAAVFMIMSVLPEMAAASLILLTLVSALTRYPNWAQEDLQTRTNEAHRLTLELGLIGGLFLFIINL